MCSRDNMSDSSKVQKDEGWGKLVAENKEWRLWKNTMTKLYQRDLESYETDGFSAMGRYNVVYAENKRDGKRAYLVLDAKSGRPVIDWVDGYDFDFKKKMLVERIRDECDIVNMAERRNE